MHRVEGQLSHSTFEHSAENPILGNDPPARETVPLTVRTEHSTRIVQIDKKRFFETCRLGGAETLGTDKRLILRLSHDRLQYGLYFTQFSKVESYNSEKEHSL